MAVTLVGGAGHVDGEIDRVREGLETAIVAAGLGKLEKSALGILDSLASVKDLDDPAQVELANGTIVEVSNLVFSFAGRLVGALAPMAGLMDAMLDLIIPLNHEGSRVRLPRILSRAVSASRGPAPRG